MTTGSNEHYQEGAPAEDDGELDPSETLLSDPGDRDPDQGPVDPADGYRAATAFGTTDAEEHAGQSLDALLRQEEPDLSDEGPVADDEQYESDGGLPADGDQDDGRRLDGVLSALDGGLGPDLGQEQVADQAGREGDGGAEDAALHITTPR